MNKNEFRKKKLEKLKLLDYDYIRDESQKITNKLLENENYKKANNIFIYVSKENEVQTKKIIKNGLKQNKKISVPFIIDKNNMIAIEIENLDNLMKNKLGILEPQYNKNKITKKIDLAIIPCVSANEKGDRLGYGGGYYDKFLSENKNIYKICLCFEKLICENIPLENTDIRMDEVIF